MQLEAAKIITYSREQATKEASGYYLCAAEFATIISPWMLRAR